MVAFKRFDPDPEILDPEDPDFGTGTWHYDDGTSAYGKGDREEALQLWKPFDERTAAADPDALAAAGARLAGGQPPPVPGTGASRSDLIADSGTGTMRHMGDAADPAQNPGESLKLEPAEQLAPKPIAPPAGGMTIPRGLQPAAAEVRGQPLTPEQLAQKQQGVYDATMTAVGGVQQAAAERQRGREEALKAVTDHTERFKADQQAQMVQAAATKAEAEQNVAAAMATQPDPGRVIKNMSTGQMVLGALAIGLGTLGNAMAIRRGMKTVSTTDWIQKAIDDDIEQQKEDKRSRVAHWTAVFKDAQMGERAARAEMWNAAGKLTEFQANTRAQNADIQAQMMQDSATMIANGQKEVQALTDRENERLTIRYAKPEPKGAVDAVETLQKKLAARKAYEDAGATDEQLKGFDAAVGIPSPGGESVRGQKTREDKEAVARKEAELTEGEAKAEAAWDTLRAYGDAVGIQRDPKTGKASAESFSDMLVAPGLKEEVPGLLGKGKPIEAARNAALDALVRLQTGAAISDKEYEFYTKALGDKDATRSQIATHLNALETLLKSRRKANRLGEPGAPSSWK
jgi:uncharacterized protein with FMN-binding domain